MKNIFSLGSLKMNGNKANYLVYNAGHPGPLRQGGGSL